MSALFKDRDKSPTTKPSKEPEAPPKEDSSPEDSPIDEPKNEPGDITTLIARMDGEYTPRFRGAALRSDHLREIAYNYKVLMKYRERYARAARALGNDAPWFLPGVIHMLESDFDFTTHLHNGDPLTARTKNAPAGRPVAGQPPFTWEDSAADALRYDGAHLVKSWDLDSLLAFCEKYNGLGYKRRGVPSPYIWSYTDQYKKGRFTSDGIYNAESVSKQVGVAAMLKYMTMQGDLKLKFIEQGEPIVPGDGEAPWLAIARRELGVHEIRGGETPRILEYHATTKLHATEDEVPWCAAFAGWVLEKAGYEHMHNAWAQSYANYGTKLTSPKVGCIVPFRWTSTSGHVGFCVGFGPGYVEILGGNQSDPNSGGMVSIKRFSLNSVMGYRWPVKRGA